MKGHSKEDLGQKGAAAVLRLRAQSAAAPLCGCCQACKTDCQITRSILGGVYPSYCPPRGPAHASDPTPGILQKSFKNRSWFLIDFWSQNWPNLRPFGIQNPSKIDQKSDWFFHWFLVRPEASQITRKSIQNRIYSEKRDFLKNSTSPTRELHFWGSRVPKILPKSVAAPLVLSGV